MKRLLLIILLFLIAGPAYAEWTELAKSSKSTTYADPETIRRKGNFGKMWVLYDIKAIQTHAGKSYWSFKAQVEYDCIEEQIRTLAEYLYSEKMGTGEIVHFTSNPTKWTPVMPNSMDHAEWKLACGKQGSRNAP